MWPIKYIRTAGNALMSVFFIPVLTVFLVPLKDDGGYLKNIVVEQVPIFGPESTPVAAVSIVLMILFIPFCLLFSLLNFEYSPRTRDVMARHTAWVDFIYLCLKTILTLVANLSASDSASIGLRTAVLIISTGFVSLYMLVIVPYYKVWINILRTALFSGLLGASVSATVNYVGAWGSLDSTLLLAIHLAAVVLFGCVGGVAMKLRLNRLTRRDSLYMHISRTKQQARQDPTSPAVVPRKRRDSGGSRRTSMSSQPRSATRINRRLVESRPVRRKTGFFASILRTLINFYHASQASVRIIFLHQLKDGAGEDLIHLADTVYQRSIEAQKHRYNATMYIGYANFIVTYRKDWVASLAQLNKATTCKPGFSQRWISFTLSKRIDREKRSSRIGHESSIDLMKYVEFQHSFAKARRQHVSSLHHLRLFWSTLAFDDGDKQLDKMSRAQTEASIAQSRALHSYSHLLSTFPNSALLWRSYGSFLKDVCAEHDEAGMSFQNADNIEDKQAQSRHKKGTGPYQRQPTLSSLPEEPGDIELGAIEPTPTPLQAASPAQASIGAAREQDDDAQSAHGSVHSRGRSTTHTHSTGKSSSLHSVSAFSNLQAKTTYQRLESKFIQATIFLIVVFVGVYVSNQALLDVQSEAMNSVWNVIECRKSTILGNVAMTNLALHAYLNTTSSDWQVLDDFGWQGTSMVIGFFNQQLQWLINGLYGNASLFGYDVLGEWENPDVPIVEYPSQSVNKMSIRDAAQAFVTARVKLLKGLLDGTINQKNMLNDKQWAAVTVNGLNGLDIGWDAVTAKYQTGLKLSSESLQATIIGILGGVILLSIMLSLLAIRPTLKAVHYDEHLTNALMTLIPAQKVNEIVEQIKREEDNLMRVLNEEETDDLRQLEEEEEKDSSAIAAMLNRVEERKRKKKLAGSIEAHLHRTAKYHAKKCKEMRGLSFKYGLALFFVLAVLTGQSIEVYGSLTNSQQLAQMIDYAVGRIATIAELRSLVDYMPAKLAHVYNDAWGQDLVATIKTKMATVLRYHAWASFGNTQVTGVHQWLQAHQPVLQPKVDQLTHEILSSISDMLDYNNTDLTYSSPPFKYLQKTFYLFGEGGIGRDTIEASYEGMFVVLDTNNRNLQRDNLLWMLGGIFLMIVLYFIILRPIVAEIEEKGDSVARLLKMIPLAAIRQVPELREYLKDPAAFSEKVQEKAQQEKGSDDLDDTWASTFIDTNSEAYVVFSNKGIILHANPSAKKLFNASSQDLRNHNAEILVVPAYRAAQSAAMSLAAKQKGEPATCTVVAAGTEQLVHVSIRRVVIGKRLIGKETRDGLFVSVWTKASETVEEDKTNVVNTAADVIYRSQPVMILSLSGMILDANDTVKADILSGINHVGDSFVSLFSAKSLDSANLLIRQALASNQRTTRRLELMDGRTVEVTITAAEHRSVSDVQYLVATVVDLADIMSFERSFRHQEQLQQAVMTSLPMGILNLSSDDQIVDANPAATKHLGHSQRHLVGMTMASLLVGGASVWHSLCAAIVVENEWQNVGVKCQDGNAVATKLMIKEVDGSKLVFVGGIDKF